MCSSDLRIKDLKFKRFVMLGEFRNVYKDFCCWFVMVGKSMKRFFSLGVLSLFLVSMMAGIVSAEDLEDVGRTMGEGIREIFNALGGLFDGLLLGETLSVNETLSKVFMALLIGMFVYSALGTFFTDKNQKWVLNLATIAVTGLAIIGLPGNFLESVLLGYGAMGIALLMIVPFLVIFWFTVKTKNILLARGIWLFYTIYYFGL